MAAIMQWIEGIKHTNQRYIAVGCDEQRQRMELDFAKLNDRSPLGWHRRLLQAREQGLSRLCRGAQQDPRHPAPSYGLRDEEYLQLKILICMLPEL